MKKMKFSIDGKLEEVWVTDEKGLNFSTDNMTSRIEASRKFLKLFTKQEIAIILRHELFHKYHNFKVILAGIVVLLVLIGHFGQTLLSLFLTALVFYLIIPTAEILADLYAARKVGREKYLPLLKRYSELKDKERVAGMARQLTHLPHPIRYWLIRNLG